MTLAERAAQLKKAQAKLDRLLTSAAKAATLRAIETAVEETPPNGALSGTHTRTGALKQHWASDSASQPEKAGEQYNTTLANNLDYASYVNNGHRMDRHFVPGLYVNPGSGLLEYDPKRKRQVGLMVGTKTKYVPGRYMADKAGAVYHRVVREELRKLEGLLK